MQHSLVQCEMLGSVLASTQGKPGQSHHSCMSSPHPENGSHTAWVRYGHKEQEGEPWSTLQEEEEVLLAPLTGSFMHFTLRFRGKCTDCSRLFYASLIAQVGPENPLKTWCKHLEINIVPWEISSQMTGNRYILLA